MDQEKLKTYAFSAVVDSNEETAGVKRLDDITVKAESIEAAFAKLKSLFLNMEAHPEIEVTSVNKVYTAHGYPRRI